MKYLFGAVVSLFCVPHAFTHAAIIITEVAWMGTEVSANDEWIELHNDGLDSVSIDGWMLEDGASLSVLLAGTIDAGEYAVLERTDDDSAPGSAFLIYTGALANSGRTLVVRDDGGNVVDQVAGGEDWQLIGGDNTTKETPQLTSGGWVTAVATPGAVAEENGGGIDDEETENESEGGGEDEGGGTEGGGVGNGGSNPSNKNKFGVNKRVQLKSSGARLKLDIPKSITGYTGSEVSFTVDVAGLGPTLTNSLVYSWNFGDGIGGSGKQPTHVYEFPGTYIAVVEVSYKKFVAREKVRVHILPIEITLEQTEEGDLMIHNNAGYEVDIGGMVLGDGRRIFVLPKYTILAPKGTLTLSKRRTRFSVNNQLIAMGTGGRLVAQLHKAQEKIKAPQVRDTSDVVDRPTAQERIGARNVRSQLYAVQPKEELIVNEVRPDVHTGEDVDDTHIPQEKNEEDHASSTDEIADIEHKTNADVASSSIAVYKEPDSQLIAAGSASESKNTLPLLGLFGVVLVGLTALYATKFS